MASTERIERLRQGYLDSKPSICYERARIFTESFKRNENKNIAIQKSQALLDFCNEFDVVIFEDELIVGTSGKFKRSAILTPEYSWQWVNNEMDTFDKRPQDPYQMSDEQRSYVRSNIFPYWKNKSLEEVFLAQLNNETSKIAVDTGIIDNDSKWRQAVGEITPDYQDVLFKKGFNGIIADAKEKLLCLDKTNTNDFEKIIFYESVILSAQAIIDYANRYAHKALDMATEELDANRKKELEKISKVCFNVPANPPQDFHEAVQFVWFVQLGGILSENPLALNLGRFDQYMYPYLKKDLEGNNITKNQAQELIEALWIKLSEWVWTISSNTAGFFAGYNQFQNLTVGGKDREGQDATNELSFMCLQATANIKTHQPGLSVRIHSDAPIEFMNEVCNLVAGGTGFPAIHNDQVGTQMLMQAGYEAEDARDWSNCGCVVPHFRKTGEWTSAVNVNFGAALEYSLNQGKSRLTNDLLGLESQDISEFKSYEEFKEDFFKQQENLIEHSIISTILAQKLHYDMVPRPFLSACVDGCLDDGVDLAHGGAKYNVGPVLTGIGLAVVANSLAVIKKLIFEDKYVTLSELNNALEADWEGYDELRKKVLEVPKYGNDNEYVDGIAIEVANHYYRTTRQYKDIFGSPFNTAFMGISNYIPTGKVIGATPCGRKAKEPLAEGVSPFTGSDVESPLAAMRSSAKLNHELHTGGTLLNLRLNENFLKSNRGKQNLAALIQAYFNLGAFHVQFNTVSNEVLKKAQENPSQYKDLLVRVAGYSTQFINLSPEMQKAIIDRNAHSEM